MLNKTLNLEGLETRITPSTFSVVNLNDSGFGSLRQSLADADAHVGPDTIVFHLSPPPLYGENVIRLTGGELYSKGNIAIKGPGAGKLIIDGNNTSRVFHFDDGTSSTDSPVSISGLSIVHGTSDVGGGINSKESLTLNGVIVSGNTADVGGGVFVLGAAQGRTKVNISKSTVVGNTANQSAGGVALLDVTFCSIRNTVVSRNVATNYFGGGLFARLHSSGTGIAISHSVISSNTAGAGGGMYLDSENLAPECLISISSSKITANKSNSLGSDGGGGLYIGGGNAVVAGSTIQNNTARYNGGGIQAYGFGSMTLKRCLIAGNQTSDGNGLGGGGLFIQGSSFATPQPVKVIATKITDNRSSNIGGGIYATGGIALGMTGGSVSNNFAINNGGGVCTSGMDFAKVDLTVRGGLFADNSCGGRGGGMSAWGSGAISILGARVTGNNAVYGGGLDLTSLAAQVRLSNLVVNGNFASGGGGIAITSTPSFVVNGGYFKGNYATFGGGIYVENSTGSILGVTVVGNFAKDRGGGLDHDFGGAVTLQADKVAANTAPYGSNVYGEFTFV